MSSRTEGAAVERAATDLRRGLPIVLAAGKSLIVAAAEQADDALVAEFVQGGALALTDQRAAVLHIPPGGAGITLLGLDGLNGDLVRSLADPTADLSHPLRGPFPRWREPAHDGQVAAIKLAKIARLLPAVLIRPLPGDDALSWAGRNLLAAVPAGAVMAYEPRAGESLRQIIAAPVPLEGAEKAQLLAFRPDDGGPDHLAVVIGQPRRDAAPLVRLHSECLTGDLLGSLKCDCGDQLRGAIREISAAGGGILLYLAQEGRGIGLINKLRAYRLQADGFDTVDANERLGFEADERVFLPAATILKKLGFSKVKLLTNNPEKVAALGHFGIEVAERVEHKFPANSHNEAYLATKKKRSGHLL